MNGDLDHKYIIRFEGEIVAFTSVGYDTACREAGNYLTDWMGPFEIVLVYDDGREHVCRTVK
jgi:hypothetical protein